MFVLKSVISVLLHWCLPAISMHNAAPQMNYLMIKSSNSSTPLIKVWLRSLLGRSSAASVCGLLTKSVIHEQRQVIRQVLVVFVSASLPLFSGENSGILLLTPSPPANPSRISLLKANLHNLGTCPSPKLTVLGASSAYRAPTHGRSAGNS